MDTGAMVWSMHAVHEVEAHCMWMGNVPRSGLRMSFLEDAILLTSLTD